MKESKKYEVKGHELREGKLIKVREGKGMAGKGRKGMKGKGRVIFHCILTRDKIKRFF